MALKTAILFLSRANYLFLLRVIFISSAVVWLSFLSISRNLNQQPEWNILFFSIFLHQIIYIFPVTSRYYGIFDIVWLFGNTIGLVYYTVAEKMSGNAYPWATQTMIIHAVLCWGLVILLPLLLAIRFSFVYQYRHKRKYENQPSNLLDYLQPGWEKDLGGVGVLFGNSIWKAQFIGETDKLILGRGFTAGFLLAGIVAFFLVTTFTEPIQELRLIPTQVVRTPNTFTPIQDSAILKATVWNIVLGKAFKYNPDKFTRAIFADFISAVTVIPLWDDTSIPIYATEDNLKDSQNQEYYESVQTITYHCPSRIPIENATSGDDIFPQPYNDFQPDLLVTVNFTSLGMPLHSIRDSPRNSVQVMVGLTNNTDDVIAMTTPTSLIPGVNLIGIVSMEIHQTFKNPGMSMLGLFETVDSVVVGQMIHVYPDPQASISPHIIRASEIATIRIISQTDSSQWKIIRDSKEKSFLSGLSQTGGLWTFLSGIFAALFGTSLMRILFGIKPVSVFGIAHAWERNAIRKAYLEEYPAIKDEVLNVPREQRGLLCLIQDHIIDLSLKDEPNESFAVVPDNSVMPEELPLQEIGIRR